MRKMEMIERYIYAVTQKLPQSQREDIAVELSGLIEDMLEERVQDRDVTDKDMEEILMELGNPRELAEQYRGAKKYLIGPELFDSYILVLKIVLISVIAAIGIGFVIQIIINPVSILDHFIDMIVSCVTALPMAFGWTTFGFALAEYFGGIDSKDLQMDKDWKPSKLPPIPDSRRQIKRADPIAGIIFYAILIMILAFSNDYFGVWVFQDGFTGVVSFLNIETYGFYLLFIIFIFGVGIIKEALKLIYGKWTPKLIIFTAFVNVISFFAVMLMVSGPSLWNPNFLNELVEYGVLSAGTDAYQVVSTIWNQSTFWILALLAIGLIWDVIDGVIKFYKN